MHHDKMRLLLKEDKCLVLQPELVAIVGRSPALLLQQIHYWLSSKDRVGRLHKGQRWIYNTYEDWVDELKTVSRSTIHRSIAILRKFGLITIEQFSCSKGDRTNWYTINYEKMADLVKRSTSQSFASSPHDVKMTPPSTQNETIFIDTKNNNKNNLINQTASMQSPNIPLQPNLSNPPPLSQQMVDIWNQLITPDIKVSLTQRRAKLLVAAFKHKFQEKMELWQHYCQKIASSDFLMGKINKGFKATIDWALKFDSIQRIYECQFGIKSDTQENPIQPLAEKEHGGAEKGLRERLKTCFGIAAYLSWFENCSIRQEKEEIVIGVPSGFHKQWILSHFSQDLKNLFNYPVLLEAKGECL